MSVNVIEKNVVEELLQDPTVAAIAQCREIFWLNPDCPAQGQGGSDCVAQEQDGSESAAQGQGNSESNELPIETDEAESRLLRFAPYIKRVWPEVEDGIIESPLKEISNFKEAFENASDYSGDGIPGRLFLKCDSHLPISGSVKARGGIYEILKLAEEIAIENNMLSYTDDYGKLADDEFKELFSQYSVAVGSTGNLGLSIGIMSAQLGFDVTVHMSADARQWKKDMLKSKGVTVKEYPDDYEAAVAQGRREAEADPKCHFVDDENSLDLFEGYSVAARRLKGQLDELGIRIDPDHRMYVYLPCGVGGAPGGVAYGLKEIFGEDVYCFFAEPTHAPCMMLGLASGLGKEISVKDIGIDGITEADGLAVGRPSGLVAKAMKTRLTGCFSVDDSRLYPLLSMLKDTEGIFIEPSACAGFPGLEHIAQERSVGFPTPDENSIHVVWATGGAMVPDEEKEDYYRRGRKA